MAKTFLENLSQVAAEKNGYVQYGYAQVEPNHLSAQRTGQIYAQLPTNTDISILENGQFVKYDYFRNEVNFGGENGGEGEWMLVYNEIKLYRDGQDDCEFAMVKGNYSAYIYSPSNGELTDEAKSRDYSGITAPADHYSLDATTDPFHIYNQNAVVEMADHKAMVPRVFKTNVGDIFTTNAIALKEVELGAKLTPNNAGFLATAGSDATMVWQVVKVYTMPDGQPGVKVMRIK